MSVEFAQMGEHQMLGDIDAQREIGDSVGELLEVLTGDHDTIIHLDYYDWPNCNVKNNPV